MYNLVASDISGDSLVKVGVVDCGHSKLCGLLKAAVSDICCLAIDEQLNISIKKLPTQNFMFWDGNMVLDK